MNHQLRTGIILFLLFCTLMPLQAQKENSGEVPVFRIEDFRDGPALLSGQWEYLADHFSDPSSLSFETAMRGSSSIAVPSKWDEPYGYGTYRLRVEVRGDAPPVLALKMGVTGSAFHLYLNGERYFSSGTPASSREGEEPFWTPAVITLPPGETRFDIVLHISNFSDMTGGLYYPVYLGTPEQLYRVRYHRLLFDLFLLGALSIMGLYHVGLFIHRRKDISPLAFGALCFLLALRTVVYEELPIMALFPDLPWTVLMIFGYLTFSLSVSAFFLFIDSLFQGLVHPPARYLALGGSLFYSLCILFLPSHIYTGFLTVFQIFTLLTALYLASILYRAVKLKKPGALLVITGFIIIFLALIHDILKTQLVLPTMFMVPFGLLIFIFFQSMVLTRKFSVALSDSEKLTDSLLLLNRSMERFVPKEFLSLLQKESILDVQLGENISLTLTVMFADIRDFTSLSERLTPEENFRFINSFLKRMGPIIREHRGFVDKYMGDGIMALFPENPDDALSAACAMRKELLRYNRHRASTGYEAVDFGVGIHTGALMLGTIGENMRMDSTVISDAVNLASRIETLTRKHGIGIAVSEESVSRLSKPQQFRLRHLGREPVKGKKSDVSIFELEGTIDP